MADLTPRRLAGQVRAVCQEERQSHAMPFARLLDPRRVARLIWELGGEVRRCTLTRLVTFYGFLGQVISADQSCRQAVADMLAWLGPQAGELPSGEDGPYCKARRRLPRDLPQRLARQVGAELEERVGPGKLLGGRRIKIIDGTVISMPDTPENQAAYPQPRSQKKGVGFPLMRLVVVMSLYSGACLAAAGGPWRGKQTGEPALLRTLLDSFDPGDVALTDRCFCSYWQIALFRQRGVDCVLRMHQRREVDFRRGRRLGREDHLVTWIRPPKPAWMEQALYESLPAEMQVREVRIHVCVPGFRVRVLVLATTLLDPQLYPMAELARTFRARWEGEVDLRSIKAAMRMDVLRCKTPDMIEREMWMHLLAYNLVRTLTAQAAREAGLEPRQVSFTAGMQFLRSFAPAMAVLPPEKAQEMYRLLLELLARQVVGDRPNRYEPRAVKRRAKPHPLLKEPRAKARKRMLHPH
jgi:hypothetical protein